MVQIDHSPIDLVSGTDFWQVPWQSSSPGKVPERATSARDHVKCVWINSDWKMACTGQTLIGGVLVGGLQFLYIYSCDFYGRGDSGDSSDGANGEYPCPNVEIERIQGSTTPAVTPAPVEIAPAVGGRTGQHRSWG